MKGAVLDIKKLLLLEFDDDYKIMISIFTVQMYSIRLIIKLSILNLYKIFFYVNEEFSKQFTQGSDLISLMIIYKCYTYSLILLLYINQSFLFNTIISRWSNLIPPR